MGSSPWFGREKSHKIHFQIVLANGRDLGYDISFTHTPINIIFHKLSIFCYSVYMRLYFFRFEKNPQVSRLGIVSKIIFPYIKIVTSASILPRFSASDLHQLPVSFYPPLHAGYAIRLPARHTPLNPHGYCIVGRRSNGKSMFFQNIDSYFTHQVNSTRRSGSSSSVRRPFYSEIKENYQRLIQD